MGLRNCVECGKVFTPENESQTMCSSCQIAESKELKKVTDYLRKFPLASIMEVNEKTGVSQARLFRFIKSGSLKMRKPVDEFKCRICGKEIKKGSVCDRCRSKIEGGISDPEREKKRKMQEDINRKHRRR